ncbi:DNA-directed RNA polymerase subunit omega [Oscillatoria sp. FACHB-1407]|nr:DNA-directed RNA polymerase subunit omega [Oscillatoria sp. FACHB-1407]
MTADTLDKNLGQISASGLLSICFLGLLVAKSSLQKRSTLDASQLMRRAEDLINAASNRYRITVQVANRAQRRRFEEFDSLDDPKMKPVIRAIIEMSDELTQPEIIGE